jgi:hypothetical protein
MISSAVEHFVDIEGVTGSIPVSSTITLLLAERAKSCTIWCGHEFHRAANVAHDSNKGAIAAPRDKGQNT